MTITRMFLPLFTAAMLGAGSLPARADDCEGISCKCMNCTDGDSASSASSSSGGTMPDRPGLILSVFAWPVILAFDAVLIVPDLVMAPFDEGAALNRIWDVTTSYCPAVVVYRKIKGEDDSSN